MYLRKDKKKIAFSLETTSFREYLPSYDHEKKLKKNLAL